MNHKKEGRQLVYPESFMVTDDKSHDSKSFIPLAEQSKQFGNVAKALGDGAYESKTVSHIVTMTMTFCLQSRYEKILQLALTVTQEENLFWHSCSITQPISKLIIL